MAERRSDEFLQKLVDELDDNEQHGLAFGMLPVRYLEHKLTGPEVARMMELNPKGHL